MADRGSGNYFTFVRFYYLNYYYYIYSKCEVGENFWWLHPQDYLPLFSWKGDQLSNFEIKIM
jgi:hypothetical protein